MEQLETVTPAANKPRRGISLERVGLYVLLALILIVSDVPLLWMLVSSAKPLAQIIAYPPSVLPSPVTIEGYTALLSGTGFLLFMEHSAIVTTATTAIVVATGTMGAYSLARFKFPVIRWIGELSLFAYMVPSILLLVPILQLMFALNLSNDLLSLILVYSSTLLPFSLWTLRAYFLGLAADLEEAAMVDGCTRWGAFIRVVVPLAVPGMIASAIFTFNGAWSEFLFASVLVTSPDVMTLSPGILSLFPTGGVPQWGQILAAGVLMTVPLIVLFTLFQKRLVEAWGFGAMKG